MGLLLIHIAAWKLLSFAVTLLCVIQISFLTPFECILIWV